MPLNTRMPSGAISRGLGSLRRRGTPRGRGFPPSETRRGGRSTRMGSPPGSDYGSPPSPPPRRSGGLASLGRSNQTRAGARRASPPGPLSRVQQDLLRSAQQHRAEGGTSRDNWATLDALTAQHGDLYGQRQRRAPPPGQMPSQMMRNGGSMANAVDPANLSPEILEMIEELIASGELGEDLNLSVLPDKVSRARLENDAIEASALVRDRDTKSRLENLRNRQGRNNQFVPRLSRGGVPMLANGQAVPPQIAKTGGARLDAMRGAGGPPMGGPPMGGPPPPPMAPPPMAPPPQLAGGMPPMMPREEEPIEEEGGISGLPTAIVDTLVSNTSGVDEALAVLDEARNELISIAGEEDVAMEDEGMLMGEEEEIGGMLEAMLG